MIITRVMLVGAAVATIGVASIGSVGLVSATSSTTNGHESSIVDKLAEKFNLNRDEVQAVFDAERKDHQTAMKQDGMSRLEEAVQAGDLTQAEADHIKAVWDEIDALKGDDYPRNLSDSVQSQIRDKHEQLREWAENNDIDLRSIGFAGHYGRGMGRTH